MKYSFLYLLLIIFVFQPLHAETTPSAEEMEKWFMSDELTPPSQSSDSNLAFIPAPVDKPALHSINNITISPQSIKTGWVDLIQCYQHLDAVPDMEVTYNYKAMRNLKITKTSNIEHARIKGQSVQLSNVLKNARLCVSAEVKTFYKKLDGSYHLVNGPFHRQFLDSFFPYHLTMKIHYPSSKIEFASSKPEPQFGFRLEQSKNTLLIDTYFTGKLYTEITFKNLQQ